MTCKNTYRTPLNIHLNDLGYMDNLRVVINNYQRAEGSIQDRMMNCIFDWINKVAHDERTADTQWVVAISWSGPMFNTMDGGDYHWGYEVAYFDHLEDAETWRGITGMLDLLANYQSADYYIMPIKMVEDLTDPKDMCRRAQITESGVSCRTLDDAKAWYKLCTYKEYR